ncbi:MAG TPA: hypothetical protein VK192_07845 [Sphingomicrobium sp.]|jgi:uncharacterized membrane protein|nr:hypothetical protein [Sphingomicrobium sp.]
MAGKLQAIRTTLAGGILFLLPLILIVFLLSKALKVAERLSQPFVNAIGISSVGGAAIGTLVAIAGMILISLFAGLLARTRLGQAAYSALENSVLGVLPQWRIARGLVATLDTERASEVEVVLVPTDAGWCLGLVLEKPAGDWWTVFIPGAPQWTSGQLSYARSDQVHPTGLSAAQAIMLLRRCGAGSASIQDLLASLEEKNVL